MARTIDRVDLFDEGKPTPCVYFQHGQHFYVAKNKWHPLGKSRCDAIRELKRLAPQIHGDAFVRRYVYIDGDDGSGPIPAAFLKEMLASAKKNAKARGLPISISIDDLKRLAIEGNGCCSMTGIRYEYGVAKEVDKAHIRRKRIWAPSIDRIESQHGYEPWNIRIVCVAVNVAMQEFGAEVLRKIGSGLAKMEKKSSLEIDSIENKYDNFSRNSDSSSPIVLS